MSDLKPVDELQSAISTTCNMFARDDSATRDELSALLRRSFLLVSDQLQQKDKEVESLKDLEDHLNKRDKINRERIEQLQKQCNYFEQSHLTALKDINGLHREIEQLQKDKAELVEKYNELIMQVANKIPDETRHETALRYIKQAEKSDDKCTANITL